MMQTKHVVIALLFILIASLPGCSAKEDPVDVTPIRLTTDAKDLTAFRGVSAVREDGAPLVLDKAEYAGTIGDVQVPMRFFDGGLVFLVPYGVVGAVELVVDLNGVTGVLPLEILSLPEIADPVATMTAFFDEETAAFDEMEELISELVELGKLPQSALDERVRLRAQSETIRRQFHELAPEERQFAAVAISIFKSELGPDSDASSLLAALHSKSHDDMESMKPLIREFMGHVGKLMAPVLIGFGVGAIVSGALTSGTMPWLGASAGASLAAVLFWNRIERKINDIATASLKMVEVAFVPSDIMMNFFKSTFIFQGDEPVPVGIDVGWRNVRSDDARTSAFWISSFVIAIEKTNEFIKSYSSGPIRIQFAAEVRDMDDPHSLSALKVVEISKPGVSCAISGSTERPELRCKPSEPLSEPLKFTFRLEYKVDAFTLLSDEMTGELAAESECDCQEGFECADCDGTPNCLGSGETCCGQRRCQANQTCGDCNGTPTCLEDGETCCGQKTCEADQTCGDCNGTATCLGDGETCCGQETCEADQTCGDCNGTPTCLRDGETCCGTNICAPDSTCNDCGGVPQCIREGETCCGDASICGTGEVCLACDGWVVFRLVDRRAKLAVAAICARLERSVATVGGNSSACETEKLAVATRGADRVRPVSLATKEYRHAIQKGRHAVAIWGATQVTLVFPVKETCGARQKARHAVTSGLSPPPDICLSCLGGQWEVPSSWTCCGVDGPCPAGQCLSCSGQPRCYPEGHSC